MSITVHCTHCQTSFPVDPDKVPEGGVRARCTNCEGVFRVEKPVPLSGFHGGAMEPAGASATIAPDVAEPEVPEQESEWDTAESAVQAEPQEPEESSWDLEEDGTAWDADEDSQSTVASDIEFDAFDAFDSAPAEVESGFEGDDEEIAEPDPDPVILDDATVVADPVEEEPDAVAEIEPVAESDETESDETESEEDQADALPDDPDEWVFETEETIDAASLDIAPMDTIEGQVRSFQEEEYEAPETEGIGRVLPGREEETFAGYSSSSETDFEDNAADDPFEGVLDVDDPETDEDEAEERFWEPDRSWDTEEEKAAESPAEDPPVAAAPESDAAEGGTADSSTGSPTPEVAPPPQRFQFGKRDPNDKAQRLARVLVSDMITYNPERHRRALEAGTLKEDFDDEIGKSWQEYTGQVGHELAASTPYWTDALNEILARGEQIF